MTVCFAQAADEASLERLFLTSIKNFLIDEAKKTPRGKLRRRIARLMNEDTAYRKSSGSPPRWALLLGRLRRYGGHRRPDSRSRPVVTSACPRGRYGGAYHPPGCGRREPTSHRRSDHGDAVSEVQRPSSVQRLQGVLEPASHPVPEPAHGFVGSDEGGFGKLVVSRP